MSDCNFARVNRAYNQGTLRCVRACVRACGICSSGYEMPSDTVCNKPSTCIVSLPYALCRVYVTVKPHLCSPSRILRCTPLSRVNRPKNTGNQTREIYFTIRLASISTNTSFVESAIKQWWEWFAKCHSLSRFSRNYRKDFRTIENDGYERRFFENRRKFLCSDSR